MASPVVIEVPPDQEPPARDPAPPAAPAADERTAGDTITMVQVGRVRPNPRQPRREFDEAQLASLAASIRTAGLMQPIVVRPSGDGYELVAGERRWRAARLNEMDRIPALVRAVDDRTAGELALIENIQREDLNALERAEAFHQLIEEFSLTHADVAEAVGLERSTVTNHLRLLDLDEPIRRAVGAGQLSLGHAKALLSITNIEHRRLLADQAIRRQWSVRELERRARRDAEPTGDADPVAEPATQNVNLRDLERRLADHLGTKVRIHPGRRKGTGRLVIEFYDLGQFEGLLGRLDFRSDDS